MNIGLFIPCYIEQFYPQVAIASLALLEKLDCQVHYPLQQTCCGQPLANSGMETEAIPIYKHFIQTFQAYDYIVAPSGSCIYHVRHHYDILESSPELNHIRNKSYDLIEFLVDILKLEKLDARFPHKVGLHQSCHGLRGLNLASSSEKISPDFSKTKYLLNMVKDLELVPLQRLDECCGFGGTFAVNEAAVSVKMGKDRILDHQQNQAQYITAGDMSCLMHLEGIIKKEQADIQVKHIVEILNSNIT